jgi:hypothetical protein
LGSGGQACGGGEQAGQPERRATLLGSLMSLAAARLLWSFVPRNHEITITGLAALGGLLTGGIGMVLGLLNYIRSRTNTESFIIDAQAARRATASSEFLKEYYGPEFMIVRSEAWNVGFDFCHGCHGNDDAYHQVAMYLIGDPAFDPRSTNVPPARL